MPKPLVYMLMGVDIVVLMSPATLYAKALAGFGFVCLVTVAVLRYWWE